MCRKGVHTLLRAAGMAVLALPALSQPSKVPSPTQYGVCGAANGAGPNSTNYYGKGNPCAFTYSVPEERENQLLRENPQCTIHSRTAVNCSTAVTGNYGQIRLSQRDGAGMG